MFAIGCTASDERNEEPTPPAAETKGATITEPLLAWSFEPASADCNGWRVTGAVAIRAIPARTGAYSCKLCADGSEDSITLTRDLGPVSRGRYELSAWVRTRVQNPAPAVAVARLEAGETMAKTAPVSLRNEWDPVATTLDFAADADQVRVTIGAPFAAKDECIFVDDVRVEKL